MGIFFSSDFHLGHKLVASIRGFDNTQDHDDAIIRNINKRVKANDELWVVGDIAMGGWRSTIGRMWELECENIHCIIGNHDRVFAGNSRPWDHMLDFKILGNFVSVQSVATMHGFMVSHFPYEDIDVKSDEGRYEQYRLRDLGKPIIHGHTHSTAKYTVTSQGTPQVHVGLDAWDFKPVSLFEVNELMG